MSSASSSSLAAPIDSHTSGSDFELRSRDSRDRSRSPSFLGAKESLDLATKSQENVFLFVPNLIGYVRIILAGISLSIMNRHPRVFTLIYFVSSILDVADGKAARMLDQTSKFGGVLDMVTDRCATACLLCYLAAEIPSWALFFQFLISLDFSSHYMHMYSSLSTGSMSHKLVTADVSRILSLYYTDRTTLFIFCFCNETFFVCLYLLTFKFASIGLPSNLISKLFLRFVSPPDDHFETMIVKKADQFFANLSLPMLVAVITGPIWLGKQIINIVQFWKASKILVGLDIVERQNARVAKLKESKSQ